MRLDVAPADWLAVHMHSDFDNCMWLVAISMVQGNIYPPPFPPCNRKRLTPSLETGKRTYWFLQPRATACQGEKKTPFVLDGGGGVLLFVV